MSYEIDRAHRFDKQHHNTIRDIVLTAYLYLQLG